MRYLHSTDECECKYVFTAVENLGKLVLEVTDVGLEAVTLLHFDLEEVMVVLPGLRQEAY